MTRPDRLTRDDYQAAMAALDWQDRRRIELASRRSIALDDPVHAALAAERAMRSIVKLYWGLVSAPVAGALLYMGITGDSTVWTVFGLLVALAFLVVVARLAVHHRARLRHLAIADFETARDIALTHRTTYRRRY